MPIALSQLPDDIDALKSLVADQSARNEQLTTENQYYKTQVLTLQEQLDIIPARIRAIRHIRKKYACTCGQCIKTALLPAQPIPKSMASPGLLAHIAVSKYQDALPLYRQETILQRIGVDLPRATLANWMVQAGTLIQPVINLLRDRLLDYDILQMDETAVQVLNEQGKTAQSNSYLWLQRGGPPD